MHEYVHFFLPARHMFRLVRTRAPARCFQCDQASVEIADGLLFTNRESSQFGADRGFQKKKERKKKNRADRKPTSNEPS